MHQGVIQWIVVATTWFGFSFALSSAQAADWTGFRGAAGLGTASAKSLPITWDAQQNITWKQSLPGLGSSSPVIVGTRIYVTCYSGYAESIDEPGEMESLNRHLVCFDARTGMMQWQKSFQPKLPESVYSAGNDSRHGYASSTPTTDGEHLYLFFGASGVYCLDMDGNEVWHTSVGEGTHHWGSGTSPRLYKNLVILNASIESQSLVALNKATGKEVWRVEGIGRCWSSPMLVDVDGRQEVVLNVPKRLTAYDPETGNELWYCDGIPDGYVCPSVISHNGIVYAIGGRKNTTIAVRAGGAGDVTESHVLWTAAKGSNVASPIYAAGHLYWFHESRGIAYCLNAETGEVVYEKRLTPRPGLIYSSVLAADGKLYAISQNNGTYVLAAMPQFKQLAVNTIEGDDTRSNASIVVWNDQLIMRTDSTIYSIGK